MFFFLAVVIQVTLNCYQQVDLTFIALRYNMCLLFTNTLIIVASKNHNIRVLQQKQ